MISLYPVPDLIDADGSHSQQTESPYYMLLVEHPKLYWHHCPRIIFFLNGYIFCLHSVSGWLITSHQSSIKLTTSEGYWNMKGQKEKWIWYISEFGISCYRKRMFWNSWFPKLKSECSGLSAILVKCVSGFCHFKINATIFPLGYGLQILNNTTQMMSSCNC